MGGLLCKSAAKEEPVASETADRRVRSRNAATAVSPSVAVLGNFDLLQRILRKLAPEHGCSLDARLQVASVCRLWRGVAATLPLKLHLSKPLTTSQVEQLKSGDLGGIRHITFAGSDESRAHEVLESPAFSAASRHSLVSISSLPFRDELDYLERYTELSAVGLCRRNWLTLLELMRGTRHSLAGLANLRKLTSLTLKDLAGPQAALDLSHLPSCLKNLHLINTSFVHHPEMELPSGMHLDCLTSTSLGRRNTIVPVELLRRAKQAILRGKELFLTGIPTDHPAMADDSVEVVMNGGMLFLFGFGQPQVQHETNTAEIMKKLENSDLQVLRLCTELGGTTHVVDRSDCRKGLRWKSLEAAQPSRFVDDVSAAGEAPPSGFACRVEERHADGSIHSLCLSRTGAPGAEATSAIEHLLLLQKFLVTQLMELEEHVRFLNDILDQPGENAVEPGQNVTDP